MGNPKTVLLVGPYPPPFGGIASHIEYFVTEMIHHDYKPFIVATGRKQEFRRGGNFTLFRVNFKKEGFRLFSIDNIVLNLKCFSMLYKYKLSFRDILREIVFTNILKEIMEKEDIKLISFYSILTGFSIPVLRKVLGVKLPIVMTMYATIYENTAFFQSHLELTRSILNMTDKLIASSKYSAKSVDLLGFDSSNVVPVYYGIDLDRFSLGTDGDKIRNKLGIKQDKKVLLFVGRMRKDMGLNVILEVAPKIFAQRKDAVLLIIGTEDELTEQVYQLQKKYEGLLYVKVNTPFDELANCYACCDVLLAPTQGRHASMGMSIKEAMASGKAVIAADAEGIREAVIDKQTGILVSINSESNVDPDSLYKAVMYCLDNPEFLKKMGAKARKRAQELFDKNLTCRKMFDIFDNLLQGQE